MTSEGRTPSRCACGEWLDDGDKHCQDWPLCVEQSGRVPSPQYGVRFRDGSVMHRWNGRTQEQRAREELARCQAEYPNDAPHLALVMRAGPDEPWVIAPALRLTPPGSRL